MMMLRNQQSLPQGRCVQQRRQLQCPQKGDNCSALKRDRNGYVSNSNTPITTMKNITTTTTQHNNTTPTTRTGTTPAAAVETTEAGAWSGQWGPQPRGPPGPRSPPALQRPGATCGCCLPQRQWGWAQRGRRTHCHHPLRCVDAGSLGRGAGCLLEGGGENRG